MFRKALCFSVLLHLAAIMAAAQEPPLATRHRQLIRAAPFYLTDSNFRYDGVEVEAGDVCLHYDALRHRGRNYYWSDAMSDGLFVEGGNAPSKIYQPYDLAARAGWHTKSDASDPNNNVWGLFESGGKIWMGTNGLGILGFDPRLSAWSRYDWQQQARPGVRTYLLFVDEKYMFFTSRGGIFVYSWKYQVCAQLAEPLDMRVDTSGYKNGSVYLRIKGQRAKSSYYAALEREFSRLKPLSAPATQHPRFSPSDTRSPKPVKSDSTEAVSSELNSSTATGLWSSRLSGSARALIHCGPIL